MNELREKQNIVLRLSLMAARARIMNFNPQEGYSEGYDSEVNEVLELIDSILKLLPELPKELEEQFKFLF